MGLKNIKWAERLLLLLLYRSYYRVCEIMVRTVQNQAGKKRRTLFRVGENRVRQSRHRVAVDRIKYLLLSFLVL